MGTRKQNHRAIMFLCREFGVRATDLRKHTGRNSKRRVTAAIVTCPVRVGDKT